MASTSKSSGSAPIAASSAIQQAYKSHQAAQAQQAAAQSSSSQGGGGISIKGLTQGQVNRMAGILGVTQPINTTFSDQFSQNLFNYMESGNRTSEMTNHYLNLVNGRAEAAQTADERNTWLSIANDLNGVFVSDLYSEKDRLTTEGDALKRRQEYANNVMRSTSAAMNGYGEGWSGYAGQQARNDKYTSLYNRLGKDIEANTAALDAINSQIFDALASDDIKAMRDRLTAAGNAKQTWDVYSALGAKNQHEAGMMKMNEQAELDRFVESLGQKPQYYNFNDRMMGVGGNFVMKTAGAATNLVAAGANEADFYNSLPEDLRMLVSDPEAMSKATPEQLAQMDAYRKQFDANSGNGGRIAQFADNTEKWADKLDLSSQREIEKAKQGLNKYGQFGIDMASTALDIGFDTATGLGLGSMFARVAGQGIGEARRAGATSDQQIAYGLTQATIEILTEKMSDGLSLAYGKGVSTDIVEDVIKKLGASGNGANLLRLLAGAIGEGGEEVISDLLNPFTQWIIDQNARDNRTYELDPSELLRDFLLGSSMGLLGSVGEAATGGYTEKNGAIYNSRVEADIDAYDKLSSEKQALADDTKAKMDRVRAGKGTIARSVIDGYYQGKDGGISSQRLASRITQMLNNPAEMRIFERETGQKIQGATIAEQRASVKQILESGKFATDAIKTEAQKKAGELKEKETAYEQNKSKATKIYEKVLNLKVKEAAGADIAPEERLTKEEFNIAAAAGWVDRADRSKYTGIENNKFTNGKIAGTVGQVASRLGKGAKAWGENRHQKTTNPVAANIDTLGYGNVTGKDEAYRGATGVEPSDADAQADAESWAAANNEPLTSGGDAAVIDYSKLDAAELNKLWKQHKITSGQYADLMVQNGFWDEAMAKTFISTVRGPESDRKRGVPIEPTAGDESAANPATTPAPAPAPAQPKKKLSYKEGKQIREAEIDEVIASMGSKGYLTVPLREGTRDNEFASDFFGKKQRNRIIRKSTLEMMKEASQENPIYFYSKALTLGKGGLMPERAAMYDGNTLFMIRVKPDRDGRGGYTREYVEINLGNKDSSAAKLQAVYITGMITPKPGSGRESPWGYVPKSAANDSKWAMNLVDMAQDILTEYGMPEDPYGEKGVTNGKTDGKTDGNDAVQGAGLQGGTGKGEGENTGTDSGRSKADQELLSRAPKFRQIITNPDGTNNLKDVEDRWLSNAKYISRGGGKILDSSEIEQRLGKKLAKAIHDFQDTFNIPVTVYRESGFFSALPCGFMDPSAADTGIYVSVNSPHIGTTMFHEMSHVRWAEKGGAMVLYKDENGDYVKDRNGNYLFTPPKISRRATAIKAMKAAHVSSEEARAMVYELLKSYGIEYASYDDPDKGRQIRPDEWYDMTDAERLKWFNTLEGDMRDCISERMYEEICNWLITNDSLRIGGYKTMGNVQTEMANELVASGIYTQEEIDKVIKEAENINNLPSNMPMLDKNSNDTISQGGLNSPVLDVVDHSKSIEKKPDPHTPKTVKPSQSAAKGRATRGENAATETDAKSVNSKLNTGDGTFLSTSNQARSDTADKLTATQQAKDEQYDRLIGKEKGTWTDDDVVICDKLRGDMLKDIRDYQMGLKKKMTAEAFSKMTLRYNALTLRHITEKSLAGQKLQAKYVFSTAEEILNRAAHTFLGFTKDGRFAGKAPNATNAKIYAGIEDAAGRIQKAVENKDSLALAQICKDISDIRGVKKMFGPAYGFASKMENEILSSIASQENGLQALETLAYGNLNAICDDVQPYKAVNAAKTIRIMNMLSNMSTIINNVTNNIASGMTSTNPLANSLSVQASKAFSNLTGNEVLTKSKGGWLANSEIRNAEFEALKMATLVQMYGVNTENGKLELSADKGLFNPNSNAFESTMALYKFFIGMGVEATDQVKSAGLQKAMNMGIDEALAKGKIDEHQAEEMRREAKHEVDRLLYKDDSKFANTIQYIRDRLNDVKTWGNDDVGTIGLGDIAMAFAKVPANVVRARLFATPEGCLFQVGQYVKGVQKAKRMHSEVVAKGIMEAHAQEKAELQKQLQAAYDLDRNEIDSEAKKEMIDGIKQKMNAIDRQCWNECREQCSGGVYNRLAKIRNSYGQGIDFDECCKRAGYEEASEMSQFEAASYSRKIGKAATSAGMVVLGAVLRGLGALRDFDNEPDEELRKMYKQKGYTGLMLNLSAIGRKNHEWRDGDNILSADFLEVIALPLAIGACATDSAILAEKGEKTKSFFKEMGLEGLGKAFEAAEDIPGMADAIGFYNAFNNQYNSDNAANGSKLANSLITYAANSLPSFFIPNAFTQAAAGLDNTVRDVYTTDNVWQQAWNIVKNKGGLAIRSTIPASVDMWGDERKYGENRFWGVINKSILPGDRLKYRQDKYESEIIRLSKAGYKGAIPKISVNGSFEVDGETYTMDADEKRSYKQNRNTEQAAVFRAFIDSDEYDMLTDDQKVAVLKDLKMDCERDAKQAMLNDRGLEVEVTRAKWETELETVQDQITYLSLKQIAGAAWDSEENRVSDYAAMDKFLREHYGDLTQPMREILDSSMSQLDKMYDARKVGINSEMWQKAYDIYKKYNSEEGEAAVDGGFKDWEATEMWTEMEKATGASNAQMNWFEENMGLMRHMRVNPEHYQDLTDKLGWSREASSYLTKAMSELQPSNGNKTVSYKQRLRCIAETPNVSDDQKWEAFYEYCPSSYTKIINGMTNLRNRGYTYEQALKTYKSGKNSMWWKYEGE